MTGKELGFLLLTSRFGNPERKVLSTAQLRVLSQRMQTMPLPTEERDLEEADLVAIGYGRDMAQRIVSLLDERELLEHYLRRGERLGCAPISRVSQMYPACLKT